MVVCNRSNAAFKDGSGIKPKIDSWFLKDTCTTTYSSTSIVGLLSDWRADIVISAIFCTKLLAFSFPAPLCNMSKRAKPCIINLQHFRISSYRKAEAATVLFKSVNGGWLSVSPGRANTKWSSWMCTRAVNRMPAGGRQSAVSHTHIHSQLFRLAYTLESFIQNCTEKWTHVHRVTGIEMDQLASDRQKDGGRKMGREMRIH